MSRVTKNLTTRMQKKLARLRAKIDVAHAIQLKLHERMNKKQIVTSYGCNKNHDNEIKKNSLKNSGSDSKRQNFTNKTSIVAETTTFCIKPLTHYLSRSALKISET